jgi:arylsulfatase A-like enzyme
MDWTATILGVTQTRTDPNYPIDGQDLFQVIKGVRPVYERTIFWRTRKQDALRSGKWKYLREGDSEYLFDLSVDEREQANFKEKSPNVFKQLQAEYQKWQSQMLPLPEIRSNSGS